MASRVLAPIHPEKCKRSESFDRTLSPQMTHPGQTQLVFLANQHPYLLGMRNPSTFRAKPYARILVQQVTLVTNQPVRGLWFPSLRWAVSPKYLVLVSLIHIGEPNGHLRLEYSWGYPSYGCFESWRTSNQDERRRTSHRVRVGGYCIPRILQKLVRTQNSGSKYMNVHSHCGVVETI